MKYSVLTLFPLSSALHKSVASLPESLHTVALTIPEGASISFTARPSCTTPITEPHNLAAELLYPLIDCGLS